MRIEFCGRGYRALRARTGRVLGILMAVVFCGGSLIQSGRAADTPPKDLAGFGFGVGIATNFDVGGRRVGTASVVNNVVRVEDSSSNASVSFVLETHYFLQSWKVPTTSRGRCQANGGDSIFNCTEIAHGPFVAVEIGGGNNATTTSGPITGYGMGWMFGMRHPFQQPASTSSWNFGVGLRVTPNAKVLGDGIVANQALPAGDSIRYKTEPRYGVMLMSTFSF
ncbi:MAG: hypothetical protein WCG92_20710 [Hyphomicrobiales bacterium]|nr:hypothetical protein [Alphaproteobacteria bacterium]